MKMLILVLLSVLAFSNAIPIPSPGKELIYEYNAIIRLGSNDLTSIVSQFILNGNLHIQHENPDSMLLRFDDLTFKLFNGELNNRNEFESKALPIPQEINNIKNPFRLSYDKEGKIKNIVIQSGTPDFIKNLMKSIASMLQLDRKNLNLENKVPNRRAFTTEENGIYGRGNEEYNVEFQENQILVQKMRSITSSRNWYAYSFMNVEPIVPDNQRNKPISARSEKLYTIMKNTDGDFDIKKIEAQGGIYIHMLRGLMDSQYVLVNQTLNLIQRIPIENKLLMNNEGLIEEIEFQLKTETQTEVMRSISLDRHKASQEQFVRLVQLALENALTYLESNHLTLEVPDVHKGQAINRLQQLIGYLEIPTLEQLYTNLEKRTGDRNKQILNIFQQILPLVGSRATSIFIKQLVLENKLKEDIIISLLNKLPLNLRMPSEKLLQEMEILADLNNDYSLNIRRIGVLSFASLVHRVYSHKINPQQNLNNDNAALHKFIRKFLTRLQESKDYATQLLNIQALYNIQTDVNRYLEKYVKGEGINRNIQYWAMCASMAEDIKDPERVHEIYWPIFTNRNLHIELRATAYFILMSTQVTMDKLWNIYWFLQTEQSPELYNFIYTNLQSIKESKNPLLRNIRIDAAQILKYFRKPMGQYLSSNLIYDYQDPKYDFGAMIHSMSISTKTSKTLCIDLTNNFLGVPYNLYTVFLRIDGLDTSIADKLPQEQIIRMNIAELEKLGKIIMSLPDNKNIHIEYSLLIQNQVVRIEYFNQSNIKELLNNIKNLQIEKMLQSSLQIQYNILSQVIMPNDLGFPTILQLKAPQLTNNYFNIIREIANKITNIQGNLKLQTSFQTTIDIKVYNPIADIWQGVQRINSYDHIIPLNFNLAINSQLGSVKLTINANQDPLKGIIGLRNHVRNQIYVIGDEINNFLKQSNSLNKMNIEINSRNKNNMNLFNYEDENTGLRYEISVYDSERQVSKRNLVDFMNLALRSENRNDQGQPLIGLLLSLRNIWSRILLYPGFGTSGVIIRAVPSTINKVSQIDLSFRLHQETNQTENTQSPTTKINTRATYSMKQSENKLLKTWDINANLELNSGHTINNLKVQISRIIPEQKDYRICIEGIKKWMQNGVTAHLSIATGQLTDNKCVKDDTLIDINMKGEFNQEQGSIANYNECSLKNIFNPLGNDRLYLPTACIQQHTAIRRYEYDIKTSKLPQEMTNYLNNLMRMLQELTQLNVIQYQTNRYEEIKDNNMRITVEFAPYGNDINLVVMKPKETFTISGIQLPNIIGLNSDNYHFSQKFLLLKKLGLINSCVISQQNILNSDNEILNNKNENENEWIIYIKDRNDNSKFNVAMRKVAEQNNLLGIRIVNQEQTLEILPFNNQYQVTLNGQSFLIDKNIYRQENWFSIGFAPEQQQSLLLQIPNYDLYIQYSGEFGILEVSKSISTLEGICLNF